MGAFQRILQALHRVFDKDPQRKPVVSVFFDSPEPYRMTIEGQKMTVRAPGALVSAFFSTFAEADVAFAETDFSFADGASGGGSGSIVATLDLSAATVEELVDTLNTLPNCTATLQTVQELTPNLIRAPQEFTDPTWEPVGVTVTANAATGPDGKVTADTMMEGSGTTHHLYADITDAPNSSWVTLEAEVAPVGGKKLFALGARTRSNLYPLQIFDLSTGKVYGNPNAFSSIAPTKGGFYRCTYTFNVGAGATVPLGYLMLVSEAGMVQYAGTSTRGVALAWASLTAQVERNVYGDLLARGLYEVKDQEAAADGNLYYPESLLWAEIQAYGWLLDEQQGRLGQAEDQMYLHRASGKWLRHWGEDYFGIPRYTGESDDAYASRLIYEIVRPNQNNVALEMILKDALGVDASIRDAWPLRADLPAEDQPETPGYFFLEMQIPNELSPTDAATLIDRCKDVVRRYKAAGTDFFETVLSKHSTPTESIVTTEAVALLLTATVSEGFLSGPIKVGAGWKVGAPGLKVGTNDALKEQVAVTVLNAGDNSVANSYLYGG